MIRLSFIDLIDGIKRALRNSIHKYGIELINEIEKHFVQIIIILLYLQRFLWELFRSLLKHIYE